MHEVSTIGIDSIEGDGPRDPFSVLSAALYADLSIMHPDAADQFDARP
jgi:hypothetical protein